MLNKDRSFSFLDLLWRGESETPRENVVRVESSSADDVLLVLVVDRVIVVVDGEGGVLDQLIR